MKKQYIIARYFKGWHVETMCEPTTKKDASFMILATAQERYLNLLADVQVMKEKIHRTLFSLKSKKI